MKVIAALIIAAIVVGLAGLAFMYLGVYNVSAMVPDPAPMQWAARTTMTQSVLRHARGIEAPNLNDPARIKRGFDHYHEMCVICHGAPGVPPSDASQGLFPPAPNLAKVINQWTPSQAFWIIKNGIKMTSMPAWGPTNANNRLWDIVSFLETLPGMTPQQYQALEKAAGSSPMTQ